MEIPQRTQYDAAFARKISRLSTRHRNELIALMGHPPDVSRVPASFWAKVEREHREEIAAALLLLFGESFRFHVTLAGGSMEPRVVATMQVSAEAYAARRSAELAKSITDGLKVKLEEIAAKKWTPAEPAATPSKSTTAASDAAKVVADADEAISRAEVLAEILKTQLGPNAAARIAVTETTAAQTAGGDAGIEATVGTSPDDVWQIHPELSLSGTCPQCRPLDGRPRRIWEVDAPNGPPLHANCNCEIIYANARVGVVQPATVQESVDPTDGRWVTIGGKHVFIKDKGDGSQPEAKDEGGAVGLANVEAVDKRYKPAGDVVSGLAVLKDIPNTSSIESSLYDYTTLDGVREMPMSDFTYSPPYSASERERTEDLASRIKASKEIKPLIVVVDKKGPYILEGGHRFDALNMLGVKSFPALVVVDNSGDDAIAESADPSATDGRWVTIKGHPVFIKNKQGDAKPAAEKQTRIRPYTKDEMIARGADGHLAKGYERFIPVEKVVGREPTPASAEGKEYQKGQEVTQPIEVKYDAASDTYTLYAGNHRITQAELNGQAYIRAFVEPDGKLVGDSALRQQPTETSGKQSPTDSPAFKAWFGNSKVVDSEGKPLVVYHGTDKPFDTVDMSKGAQGVFWVTSDKGKIERGESGAVSAKHVIGMYASLQNPAGWKEYDQLSLGEIESRGHDGVILRDKDGTFDAIIFKPSQVKLADGNKGTFDPNNPDMRESQAA